MPSGRLLLLAIGVCAAVLALVVGSAIEGLRSSFDRTRSQTQRPPEKPEAPERRPERRPDPSRYTPARSRLRWYSPEIAAILLLSLAAGLWLARLVG